MLANSFGYKFNHVDNSNKFAQSAAFSKTKSHDSNVDLEDFQRVNSSAKPEKQGNYKKEKEKIDLDGIKKDDAGKEARKTAHKAHIEKMFGVSGTEKSSGKATAKGKEQIEKDHKSNKHDGFNGDCPLCECETCKNRRYQDGSNDSAVSFQQPTKMSPAQAAHKVKAHEMEHVRREQFKAKESGRRIISQSVQIQTKSCEECGKIYVSGGVTRTTSKRHDPNFTDLFRVGAEDMFKGGRFNATA